MNLTQEANFAGARGVLSVKPIGAEITDPKLTKQKLKLFCRVRLGKGILETVADTNNGIKPRWTSNLSFVRQHEENLLVELYSKNIFTKPTLLGACCLSLDALTFIAEVFGRCQMEKDGKSIANLDIQIKWQPDQGPHPSPISRATFLNDGSPYSHSPSSPLCTPRLDSSEAYFVTLHGPLGSDHGRQTQARHISLPYFGQGLNLQHALENFSQGIRRRISELTFEEEPIDTNLSEEKRCTVCWERKRAGVFYQCGHSCCCAQCGVGFIGSRCPICRELVFDFIKVFEA